MALAEFVEVCDAGLVDFSTSHLVSLAPESFEEATLDPDSEEYVDFVMRRWSALTGRAVYEPTVDEAFEVDMESFLARPYPFSTGDPIEIGRYLGAVAGLLRRFELRPPARVAELGAGWGLLSMTLATAGYDVTAVDLNADSVRLLKERARRTDVPLEVVRSGFLEFVPSGRFDAVVFFEAFHHCDRPLVLLDRCAEWLNPGGRLVFVAEAVYDDFYVPWGLRLDGSAAFAARKFGWLELGFSTSYFYRQLLRRGFSVCSEQEPELGPYGTFLTARRWGKTIEPGRTLLPPEEEATWTGTSQLGGAGRAAATSSVMTLPDGPASDVDVRVVNLADAAVRAELSTAGCRGVDIILGAGQRETVSVSLPAGQRQLVVASDVARCGALDLAEIGIVVEAVSLPPAPE